MTLETLRADARFLVFGSNSNTQYGNTDLDRNINKYYEKGLVLAIMAAGNWKLNGDIAYGDLVAGQNVYALPSDALKITRVEVKLSSSGDYVECKQANIRNYNSSYEEYQPGSPEYHPFGSYLRIFTAETIQGVTDGLVFYYETDLAAQLANTTDVPILCVPFQEYLSKGPAYEYCIANEMNNKAEKLKRDIIELETKITEFYESRMPSRPNRLTMKYEDYGANSLY